MALRLAARSTLPSHHSGPGQRFGSLVLRPEAQGLDPFGACRGGLWQRQAEDGDGLAGSVPMADRHDPASLILVNLLHHHRHTQQRRLEGELEVVLDHGEQSDQLLLITVCIDRGLLYEGLQSGPAGPSHLPIALERSLDRWCSRAIPVVGVVQGRTGRVKNAAFRRRSRASPSASQENDGRLSKSWNRRLALA